MQLQRLSGLALKQAEICSASVDTKGYMNYSRNSLKCGYIGDLLVDYYRGLLRGILGVWTIAHMGGYIGSRLQGSGFPKVRCTLLGMPIKRAPPISGNF